MLSRLPLPAGLKRPATSGSALAGNAIEIADGAYGKPADCRLVPSPRHVDSWNGYSLGLFLLNATRYEQEPLIGEYACPTLVCDAVISS